MTTIDLPVCYGNHGGTWLPRQPWSRVRLGLVDNLWKSKTEEDEGKEVGGSRGGDEIVEGGRLRGIGKEIRGESRTKPMKMWWKGRRGNNKKGEWYMY